MEGGSEEERGGVNVAKRVGHVRAGFVRGADPHTFNDVWLCWPFQANFVCDPVLQFFC